MRQSFDLPALTLSPRGAPPPALLFPPGAYIGTLEAQAILPPEPAQIDLLKRVDDDAQLATFTERELADAYSRAHSDCAVAEQRKERVKKVIFQRGLTAVTGEFQRWKVGDVQGAKRVNVERMVLDGIITAEQKQSYTETGKASKRLNLDAGYLPGYAG